MRWTGIASGAQATAIWRCQSHRVPVLACIIDSDTCIVSIARANLRAVTVRPASPAGHSFAESDKDVGWQ